MLTGWLCRLGVHRFEHRKNPEGEPYVTCRRCGKDSDDEGVRAALRAGWWS